MAENPRKAVINGIKEREGIRVGDERKSRGERKEGGEEEEEEV